MERLTVLGAGSWGTTLAELLANKGFDVNLWVRKEELRKAIAERRENSVYLPGIKLPENVLAISSLEQALKGSEMVLSAIPSHGLRAVLTDARHFIGSNAVIVSATKGIEEGTNLTPCSIIKEVLGAGSYRDTVVLSGPSFAKEVSLRLPAAVCAASASHDAATLVQSVFSTAYFRVYTNSDLMGVELGGALKNIIAIASGISDGLALGHNARAALITRGIAEISRLGAALGANPHTFTGLSGLGDLVLTCTGPLSRNYSVGKAIAGGKTLEEITGAMRMVAEGVRTTKAAWSLAGGLDVEMPITEEVHNVLYMGKPPKKAVMELMMRELKSE